MSNIEKLFSLKGKVALVTGAGTGMGARFAQTLADAGAKVICAARRLDKVQSVADGIVAAGGDAIALALDIGDTASVGRVFDHAQQKYGLIDVLVNNAAQLDFAPFPDVDDAAWANLFNVNVAGPMRMAREFSKRLIAADRPGAIINVTSITGQQVLRNVPCYGSAKAAVIQMTKQIAADLLDKKIRCNSIAPGYFMTDMVSGYFETEQGKAETQKLPAKRVGSVEELDGVLLLLASDASSYMNGAIIPVDYGHVMLLA